MQATFHIKRDQIHHFHMEHYNALGGRLHFHFHSHIELLLVKEGEVTVWIGNAKETVCAGQLAVVPSYEPHCFRSPHGAVKCTNLFVPTFLCPDFVEAVGNRRVQRPIVRDEKAMERICHAVSVLEAGALNAIEQNGYIRVILGAALQQLTLEEGNTALDGDLPEKLLYYINEHYREELSTELIAKALGYSANHLSKCFRARFQIGVGRYINTVRLRHAVELMHRQMGITECAMESGFSSLRTFYRAFEEEFGCPPREYLKSK